MKHFKFAQTFFVSAIIAWSILLTSTQIHAADKIIWHQLNVPPFNIVSGPGMHEGITDNLRNILLKEMPEYEHRFLKANLTRTVKDMEKGKKICHTSLIPNKERAAFMDFSLTYTLLLPPGLIVAKSRMDTFAPFMNDQGELKLQEILAANKLNATYTRARFYPQAIMEAIATYGKKGSGILKEKIDVPKTDSETDKLVDGAIDGILGYPIVAYYYSTLNDTAEKISYVKVAGTQSFSTLHAACTKGEWNKPILKRINDVIRQHREKEGFIQATLRWLPENSRKALNEYLRSELPESKY